MASAQNILLIAANKILSATTIVLRQKYATFEIVKNDTERGKAS